ncbi:MAG: cell division protein FtsQ/DivIB [Flavobacteriaceae bacterium]
MRTIGSLLRLSGDAARSSGGGSPRRGMTGIAGIRPRRLAAIRDRIVVAAGTLPPRAGTIAAAGFLALTGLYGGYLGGGLANAADGVVGAADSGLAAAGLKISKIRIAGHAMLSEEAIVDTLWLPLDGSLLLFDAGAARARLLAMPLVEEASVQKLFPNTLSVSVTERQPYARWQHDGQRRLIDRFGVVIAGRADQIGANLPLVVGKGAPSETAALLKAVAEHPSINIRLLAAIRVADRRWNLKLDNGIDIKLPEDGFAEALAVLDRLDGEQGLMQRQIKSIDLRLPDRVTVAVDEAAVKEVQDTVKARITGKGGKV